MVDQIGALRDKRRGVLSDTLDDRLDCLLTELLRDLGPAASEEPCGIGTLRISVPARLDDLP